MAGDGGGKQLALALQNNSSLASLWLVGDVCERGGVDIWRACCAIDYREGLLIAWKYKVGMKCRVQLLARRG